VNFADGLAMRLRQGGTDTGAMSAAAAQVREQAVRAGEVIRRLRSFVRKEAARREYADVNHLVQEAAHLIESEAQRKGVAIRFHLETGMLPIQVDPVQIEQVVVNLLRNGIDSVSRLEGGAGEIVVTTEVADGWIRVAIRDTGTGLPDGAEGKLFEPYFTTKPDGLGMGLSISRSIVEAHGGSMWAEPNEPRGMTFVFRLPVPRPPRSGGANGGSIPG
jgi:signal transduction histidine kinase